MCQRRSPIFAEKTRTGRHVAHPHIDSSLCMGIRSLAKNTANAKVSLFHLIHFLQCNPGSETNQQILKTVELWPFKVSEFHDLPLSPIYSILSEHKPDLNGLLSIDTQVTISQMY